MSRFVLLVLLLLTGLAGADNQAASLYFSCRSCHGDAGQGSPAINAPALAGQDADYLARQLQHFSSGIRGSHQGDIWGRQMALMAANLLEENVKPLANYIAAMPPWEATRLETAVDSATPALYEACAACHGKAGEGNPMLGSPRIAGLDHRYIALQLRNFRDGVRGASASDSYGNQMRAAMSPQLDDPAIDKLAGYIHSMQYSGPAGKAGG